jgi:tetratricopeptide (TPR) repeat protein
VASSGLFLLAVSAAAVLGARRRPWLVVGWAWFIGMLVPVIGLVQVGEQAMADRYLYLPSIGFFVLVSWSAPGFVGGWRHGRLTIKLLATSTLLACLIAAWVQTGHWKGSESLFRHTLTVTTGNYLAHDCLGETLSAQGKRAEARAEFEKALRIKPAFTHAAANLAKLHFEEKRLDLAAALFAKVAANFAPFISCS